MTQKAQAILLGRMEPLSACASIEPLRFSLGLTPGEAGWEECTFGCQLFRDQIHVVIDYAHDDSVDRGVAVAKMRRTVRNLVNWFLLGQTLHTSTTLALSQEQVIVRYEGDTMWISQLDAPIKEEIPTVPPTAEAVREGGAFLPYLLGDRLLLYALQDYASAVGNPEYALFLLYRALEWILWEYDTESDAKNPAFAPTQVSLALPPQWLEEVGRLAHSYARHARLREAPDRALVDAARARVKALILRHLCLKYTHPGEPLPEMPSDPLSGWTTPLAR